MTVRFDNYDVDELITFLPTFFVVLIGVAVLVWVLYFFLKKSDNNKELIEKRVKFLEKLPGFGNVGWYIVECENGERLKLRSFEATELLVSPGDIGILRYKGITIQSFQRERTEKY